MFAGNISPLPNFFRLCMYSYAKDSPAWRLKGEMEFDENGALIRWNNTSGTYKCANNKAYQAGLPLDKFWVVINEYVKDSGSNPTYERILTHSEEEFLIEQTWWTTTLKEMLQNNPEAQSSYYTLTHMLEQRQMAANTVG